MASMRTGAQIIWEALVREGVTTVFGYPGGAILPAYDALLEYPVRHVLVRHEQGATHMADGYARASGQVGVAIATSGPGATNMVTGIATAMLDSSPRALHHRSGGQPPHRVGRVPGDRRHRRHAADHQAQLPRLRRGRDRADDSRGALRRSLRTARPRADRHHQGRAAGLDRARVESPGREAAGLPARSAGLGRGSTSAPPGSSTAPSGPSSSPATA